MVCVYDNELSSFLNEFQPLYLYIHANSYIYICLTQPKLIPH